MRSQVSASGRVHPHWSLPRTKPLNTGTSTYAQRTPVTTEDPSRRFDREERRATPSPRAVGGEDRVDSDHLEYRGRATSSPPRSPRFPNSEERRPNWQRPGPLRRSTSRGGYSTKRRTASLERGKGGPRSRSRPRDGSTDPRRVSNPSERDENVSPSFSGRGLAPPEERELGEISPDFAPAQPARHFRGSVRDRRRSSPGLDRRHSPPRHVEARSAPLGLGALQAPAIPPSSYSPAATRVTADQKASIGVRDTTEQDPTSEDNGAVKALKEASPLVDRTQEPQQLNPQRQAASPAKANIQELPTGLIANVEMIDVNGSKDVTEPVTAPPVNQNKELTLLTSPQPQQPSTITQPQSVPPTEEQPTVDVETRGELTLEVGPNDPTPFNRVESSSDIVSDSEDKEQQSFRPSNGKSEDPFVRNVTTTSPNEHLGAVAGDAASPMKAGNHIIVDPPVEPPVSITAGDVQMNSCAETFPLEPPNSIVADIAVDGAPVELPPNCIVDEISDIAQSALAVSMVAVSSSPNLQMHTDLELEAPAVISENSAEHGEVLCPTPSRNLQIDEDLLIDAILARNAAVQDEPVSRIPVEDEVLDVEAVAQDFVDSNAKMEDTIRRNIAASRAAKRQSLQLKVAHLRREYTEVERAWDLRKTELERENERLKGEIPLPSELCDGPAAAALDAALAGELRMTTGPRVRATRGATANLQAQGALGVADGDEAGLERALLLISQADQADPTARALRTEAVVPDMLIEGQMQRRTVYDDQSELVVDPLSFYVCIADRDGGWTPQEDAEFRRLFALHPKQFGSIAKGLPGRSVGSCVEHYYTTKKIRSYKELAVGARAGPRRLRGKESALSRDLNRRKKEKAPQKSTSVVGGDSSRGDATPRGGSRRPPLGEPTASDKSVKRGRKAPDPSVDAKELEAALKSGADAGSIQVKKPGRKGTKRKPQDIQTPDGTGSADASEANRKPVVEGIAPKKRRKAATNPDGTPIPRSRKVSAGTVRLDNTANGAYPVVHAPTAIPSLGMFPEQQRTRMGPVPGYFPPEGAQYQHVAPSHAPLHDPQAFRMVQPQAHSRSEPPQPSAPVPRPRGMDIMSLLNNEDTTPQKARHGIDNDAASTASDATEDDKTAALRAGSLAASGTFNPVYDRRPLSASTVLDVRLPAWELGPARAVPRDFAGGARTIYDHPSDAILNRPNSAMAGFPPPPGPDYRYRNSMSPMMPAPPPHPDPYAPGPSRPLPGGYQQGWTGQNPLAQPPVYEMTNGYSRESGGIDGQHTTTIGQPVPYPRGHIRPTLPPLNPFSLPRDPSHDGRASR